MKTSIRFLKWFALGFAVVVSTTQIYGAGNSTGSSRVIDLGQLEIDGELRRPNVQWLDSQKKLKEIIARLYQEQFDRLETDLLKPLTLPELSQEIQKEERLVSQ